MNFQTNMLRVYFIFLLCFNLVLCSKYHLCAPRNMSCSYQLWPDNTADACEMIYYPKNTDECLNALPETPTKNLSQKGIIQIVPRKAFEEDRTIFEITALNITWTNLKIRFKQQSTTNCMKREFIIRDLVPRNNRLLYNCPWANSEIEDRDVEFEYAFGENDIYKGKRTFLIHVIQSELIQYYHTTNLRQLKLFTYVETTNLYALVCKIHVAPAAANVTSYEIFVKFTRNNSTKISGTEIRDVEAATFGVIDFEKETYGVSGEYVFYVRPCNATACGSYSISATVLIPGTSTILTIGIVGGSCLIPIFLIILYMYFKVDSSIQPRVLLITSPPNDAHRRIGTSLASLLKEKYKIETKMDLTDIPSSSSIEPIEWLKLTLNHVTHVVVLLSNNKPATSVYIKMDTLLYKLIDSYPEKICCSIEFPFTEEAKLKFHFNRTFYFMRDYNAFMNFILNRGLLRRLRDRVLMKKSDFYYDLREQINNYNNNSECKPSDENSANECQKILINDENCVNESKENDSRISMEVKDTCDDCDDVIQVPEVFKETVQNCLMKTENMKNEHTETTVTINPLLVSLLNKNVEKCDL